MAEAAHTPEGDFLGARFGGLLEGRLGDRLALERAVRSIREEGPVDVSLEVEGARFSLYLSDQPVSPERAEPQRMQAFLEGLRGVVAAAEPDGPLDSTLRCTEYYDDEVVETHIGLEEGEIAPVSRVRARAESDALPSAEESTPGTLIEDRPRRALIAIAAALLLGMLVWQGRFIDRAFGAPADELTTTTGPFDDLLAVSIASGFGGYKLSLSRGSGYPLTGADVSRLEDAAASPLERAAIAAVADGKSLEARVLNAEGEVLARGFVRTAALLLDEDSSVQISLPARIGATSIQLGMPVPKPLQGAVR